MASRLEPPREVLRSYYQVAALLVLGGAVASVALGWAFTRVVLAPIRLIERTARRIGADNLSERIPVPAGHDELVALSRWLNETFERIELAFAQVRRFTADASHELKTPLTLMRLNAEKLRRQVPDDAFAQNVLDGLLEEIERLHQIIEHLLFVSKVESGTLSLELEPLPMPAWLDDWREDAQVLSEDQAVIFTFKLAGDGQINGVPHLLRQRQFNLLTNALKFSPAGGKVVLRVISNPDQAGCQWILEDEGPGLPSDQLSRIFDRFVRYEAASAAAPTQPGHGLGLAICKGIVELHGGSI